MTDASLIPISLLGRGTVGKKVVRLVADEDHDLARRTGLRFEVVQAAVRNLDRHADAGLPLTDDPLAAATHEKAAVVVELIGGTTLARDCVLAALRAGKHVVTANKALVAAHGPELFAAAREADVTLAFEASCGGGIPVVGALCNGLLADRHDAIVGILNGTSNAILTAMTDRGETYADALKQAQDAGFAEADPTLDVNGADAAQKLAILGGLTFGEHIAEADVHREGIDGLAAEDVRYAGELGYVVKLLAVGRRDNNGRLTLSVFPGLLPKGDVLADVKGAVNAVVVYGPALGRSMLVGHGAGGAPTAAAVVADLLSVCRGTHPRLPILPDVARPAQVVDFGRSEHRYYLRLAAADAPGVLADVTRALAKAGISIASVSQRERPGGDAASVPVVVTTHVAREASIVSAVGEIDALPGITGATAVLRIVDLPAGDVA